MEFAAVFLTIPVVALLVSVGVLMAFRKRGASADLVLGLCVTALILNGVVAGAFQLGVVAVLSIGLAVVVFGITAWRR